jgi:Domain of unknown function (DUF4145)
MVEIGGNWKCPYCGHAQVLDEDRVSQYWYHQPVRGWKEEIALGIGVQEEAEPTVFIETIVCANEACRELTLSAAVARKRRHDDDYKLQVIKSWRLLPPSSAKLQPDCIPKALRDDYYEACAIRDLSPKASATITRRCLQGMIRDFCGFSRSRLLDEIAELRKRVREGNAPAGVQADSVEAIDQVREIGNIGAYMEADINVGLPR